jgi:septum formation protein
MSAPTIYLASSSPRRRMLLTQTGLKVATLKPDVDEKIRRGESARQMVLRLAVEKAEAGLLKVRRFPAIVIAADTSVVAPGAGKILGKPAHRADAVRMLRMIQGREHTVLTGYCIVRIERTGAVRELARVVSSRVRIRKMTDKEIRWYVGTGEPMDKAGSYGAQGIGMAFIHSIVGSYSNVVGLPLCEVMSDLGALGARWS